MMNNQSEVGLMDFLDVLWKKKWVILIPTIILTVAVGIYSFLQTPTWEIDAVIQPSKYFVLFEHGKNRLSSFEIREIVFVEPAHIAELINQSSFNSLAASELGLQMGNFPPLDAQSFQNEEARLVRISIREKDIERGKAVLDSFFNSIKKELDKRASVTVNELERLMESNQIEQTRLNEETKILENKKTLIGQNRKSIENEILATDIDLKLKQNEERLNQLRNDYERLKYNLDLVGYTKIIQEPKSSLYPVAPKKQLNILIGFLLSLTIFTLLAFFLDFIQKQKKMS